MAKQQHWNVTDERDMWLKVVGHEKEDHAETIAQAKQIFHGCVPGGDDCLEIGCGSGRFAPFALWYFRRYVGLDSSESILSYTPRKSSSGVEFVLGSGIYIPFTDDFFDFIFSFTCFQHMPTLEIVRANIAEAYRVLRPGGLCRVQTVQGDYLESGRYDGVVFPSAEAFAEEFKTAGFGIEDAHTEGEWIWVTART
jgi:ubiquinone/menaquinone biosynthesis C-methylase UbiE